ncbi:MAG: helix-hairpin-helix domain-containing protein [Crocinitomicaceae bacterium]|nr:helix-hairpin-helix domain-containing protein [Crocinitomicaceae bacterium]
MEDPIEFSKRSRRAILIFVTIMLVLVLLPRLYFLLNPPGDFEYHQTAQQKEDFKNFEYKKEEKTKYQKKSRFKKPSKKFDPNQYTEQNWMDLGLSEKQVSTLMKFAKSGFYSDEDLRKVFVISDAFFENIRDFLVYPEKPIREHGKSQIPQTAVKKEKVELNTASLEELMSIDGIGQFYAEKIIQKRNELQGFINEDQLLEIWKFDPEKLEIIRPFILVDSKAVIPFDINKVTYAELRKHPYFSNNVANSIIKLRTQLGTYKRIEDLKKSVLISEELYEKIKPYVSVEE